MLNLTVKFIISVFHQYISLRVMVTLFLSQFYRQESQSEHWEDSNTPAILQQVSSRAGKRTWIFLVLIQCPSPLSAWLLHKEHYYRTLRYLAEMCCTLITWRDWRAIKYWSTTQIKFKYILLETHIQFWKCLNQYGDWISLIFSHLDPLKKGEKSH